MKRLSGLDDNDFTTSSIYQFHGLDQRCTFWRYNLYPSDPDAKSSYCVGSRLEHLYVSDLFHFWKIPQLLRKIKTYHVMQSL